ncbi:alanine racemase [Microbulbifer sp. CAU 1566]|uniref:alanine racemase n=1 Tax=Microbulbifer sp. CAU 1566 TaxID=2933269 RepID=UPI0020052BD2|nr:alanine racemase [Microbulbifer sp. CAU 1566]MCK7598698.1 alanine racemase [Microbulbifer sp. CAU 1566]
MTEDECEGVLSIDLGAIAGNYARMRGRLSARSRCGAVVKADAYGLGMARVAPVLYQEGCRDFFVATLREGEALRALVADDARIFILTGVRPGFEQRCVAARLVPVLVSVAQLRAWRDVAGTGMAAAPCALKLDSGMTRLGMGAAEFNQLLQTPALLQQVNLQLVLSHLACADEPGHPQNAAQLAFFDDAVSRLRKLCPQVEASLANSAGICLGDAYHFDLVRPGCSLYGVNPEPGTKNSMSAVVNLRLPVLQLRQVDGDSWVGYGATQSVAAGSWLAVVRGGYADGMLRSLSGCGHGMAVVGGEKIRVPILGRVSMDTTVFDISALSPSQRGQLGAIEVLGPELGVDDMGAAAGTIGYEILTALGRRYCRRYL